MLARRRVHLSSGIFFQNQSQKNGSQSQKNRRELPHGGNE